ncbi:MAG: efflux RND transporter permease subunit [Saprospiraceae bacterium]|nr:efflux RND transporter permease subunit [Saprospiraceae bacterium]
MKKTIQYFVKYHITADVLLLLIAIIGCLSALNISRSQFPRVDSREIAIETTYKGASPSEVEKGITIKIEQEIDGLEGIKKVNSTSIENKSTINIEILSSFKIENVISDVKNAIDRINTFPDDVETPIIYKKERVDRSADLMISGDVDLKTIKAYAEKAEQELLALDGISKIEITGYPDEEIAITISEKSLDAFNLTFSEVALAISGTNLETTGGNLEMNGTNITIRGNNKKYYAEQLENVIIKTSETGSNVLLKEIATVKNQWADIPEREYYNGMPAAKLAISSRLNEDIIESAQKAKDYIKKFNTETKVVQAYLLRDGSIGIQQRTNLLLENGLKGIILVLLFLGLFLKPRIAFWVALSIPISIAGMFILAPIFGVNINMLSLFGLILVIGILVDDGVVIAENIFQRYERGLPAKEASIKGVLEVAPSIISAVLTTCWFFMLFFLIEGTMGDFMSNVAFVVIATLLFSLIEGFFILPAHIAHSKDLKSKPTENIIDKGTTAFFSFLKNYIYGPTLKFCLNNKMIAISVGIVCFSLSINIVMGGFVKLTFFPNIDRDDIVVNLKLPAGTTEDKTNTILKDIEKKVWTVNEEFSSGRKDKNQVILSVARNITASPNIGSLVISLLDGESRHVESNIISNRLDELVGDIYEAESLTYGQKSIFGAAIQVGFIGDNINALRKAKDEFKTILQNDKLLKNVTDNDEKGSQEFNIVLLPKANALGIDLKAIISQIRQGFFGYEVQRLQRGKDEVKVWLRYTSEERENFGSLENMKIRINNNSYPLRELVKLEPQSSSLNIIHSNGKTKLEVSASLNDPNASATEIFNNAKNNIIPKLLQKYPDVNVIYEGQSESASDTIDSMQRWLPVILLLVFFTIVLTFRSFLQAIIVILLIPFAFIGVVAGHWIHGASISILSMFGILAVAGVVINDSLVLVSTMNRMLKKGTPFKDAVYGASMSRFRPILLTSITTVAGLMPIVLETSLQAQFLIPMAIALAYGLAAATFIMLLMLPPLLIVINNGRRIWKWIWDGESLTAEEVEPSVIEEI